MNPTSSEEVHIHPSSRGLVDPSAEIGPGTMIWVNVQILKGAKIGQHCNIGKDVFIDAGVVIGNRVKIQNGVSVYHGVTVKDGAFLGPHCAFTNDFLPRSINRDGTTKGSEDWSVGETVIEEGAAIGTHATIVCGRPGSPRRIGKWSIVGAGSVVVRDVPACTKVVGNPARIIGYVCPNGDDHQLELVNDGEAAMHCLFCKTCNKLIEEGTLCG